jgi:hypothetical protein
MGRRRASVEYLDRLVEFAGGRRQFCRLTGIRQPNLTAYLNASKAISWKRLRSATSQVFGEPPAFVPIVEGHNLNYSSSLATALPRDAGLYALFDSAMRLIYYGKAANLRVEVQQTLRRRVGEVRPWTGKRNLIFREISTYLSAYTIARGDAVFRHDVEALGLRLLVNNTFNRNGAKFRRKS